MLPGPFGLRRRLSSSSSLFDSTDTCSPKSLVMSWSSPLLLTRPRKPSISSIWPGDRTVRQLSSADAMGSRARMPRRAAMKRRHRLLVGPSLAGRMSRHPENDAGSSGFPRIRQYLLQIAKPIRPLARVIVVDQEVTGSHDEIANGKHRHAQLQRAVNLVGESRKLADQSGTQVWRGSRPTI